MCFREWAASRSKLCTSSTRSINPSSCMAVICPVMPPRANRQRMDLSSIICRMNRAVARDAPPDPICMEKPLYRYPAASMTLAAVWAMSSSLGFLV